MANIALVNSERIYMYLNGQTLRDDEKGIRFYISMCVNDRGNSDGELSLCIGGKNSCNLTPSI